MGIVLAVLAARQIGTVVPEPAQPSTSVFPGLTALWANDLPDGGKLSFLSGGDSSRGGPHATRRYAVQAVLAPWILTDEIGHEFAVVDWRNSAKAEAWLAEHGYVWVDSNDERAGFGLARRQR